MNTSRTDKIDDLDFDEKTPVVHRKSTIALHSFGPSAPVLDLLGQPLFKSPLDANGLIPYEDFESKCDPCLI
jgi:hypothetical protein